VGEFNLYWGRFKDVSPQELRNTADMLRQRTGRDVVFLVSEREGKLSTVVAVSREIADRVKANEIIKELGKAVGGGGGGRADMAQGGGADPAGFERAVRILREILSAQSPSLST